MSAIDFLACLLGLVLVALSVHWWRQWMLVDEVRECMFRDLVQRVKVINAIDGHRLPKRVRDAVVVWLAERE